MSSGDQRHADLAVVGAGPAGLAAAVAAASRGLTVTVVDAGRQPGGQYWRHLDEESADALPDHPVGQHDWRAYVRLRQRFDALRVPGGITYVAGCPGVVHRTRRRGLAAAAQPRRRGRGRGAGDRPPTEVVADALVLCPGGYDRQLPVPGWDLPGVMAAGGVQALLKGHGSLAGRRAVVAGTGPFLLPVAAGLAEAGAEVLGICEANAVSGWVRQLGGAVQSPAKGLDAVGYVRTLLAHRIAYRQRTVVTAIEGRGQVESVTTARLDAAGHLVPAASGRRRSTWSRSAGASRPSLELVTAVGADTRVDVDDSLVAVVDARPAQHGRRRLRRRRGDRRRRGRAGAAGGRAGRPDRRPRPGSRAAVGRRAGRRLRGSIRRGRAFATAMHRAHPVPDDLDRVAHARDAGLPLRGGRRRHGAARPRRARRRRRPDGQAAHADGDGLVPGSGLRLRHRAARRAAGGPAADRRRPAPDGPPDPRGAGQPGAPRGARRRRSRTRRSSRSTRPDPRDPAQAAVTSSPRTMVRPECSLLPMLCCEISRMG